MMDIFQVLCLLAFASLHLTHASTACMDAYSCAYSKVMKISDFVECSGSFSCYGVSMMNTSRNFHLTCGGLYSCANVSSIGDYSLSSLSESSGSHECNGELSCFGSTFTNVTTSMMLICRADRSCLSSNVTVNGGSFYATGYLGAANSTIKIGDSASLVAFMGMESGKNTTVICSGFNTTCQIQCYNNACDELQLIYDTNNTNHNNNSKNNINYCNNCRFVVTCLFAFKSDLCPDSLDFKTELIDFLSLVYDDIDNFSIPIIPSLYNNVTTQYTNFNDSIIACEIGQNMSSIIVHEEILNNSVYYNYTINTGLNNEYPINCMSPYECELDILKTKNFVDKSIDSITVPICCTSSDSCYGSTNLKNTIRQGNPTRTGIRCDATSSCDSVSNNNTYIESNGSVYISGSTTVINFVIIDGKNSDINTNELFCTGAYTCDIAASIPDDGEKIIKNFKNVFCNGDGSCANGLAIGGETIVTFENIENGVFFYSGMSGGPGLKFNNIGNSVYCVGVITYGCSQSIFSNIMGSVYGIGYHGVSWSTINNVTNVYGFGDFPLYDCMISNVTNDIYFIGEEPGQQSIITNAKNVKLNFFLLYKQLLFCSYFL